LAFVLNTGRHVFASIGPRTIEELEESLRAAVVCLDGTEMAWLAHGR
jgi:aryl-alcohol dehydrogenase-like predicted oxidoreductase